LTTVKHQIIHTVSSLPQSSIETQPTGFPE
jgi:hypothetical protein